MKKIIIILILLLFSIKGFSTRQVEDYLIYGNDTLRFYNSPLEQIDSIAYNIAEYNNYISSNCWNGFYAEWKIVDNTLYLSKVFDCEYRKDINEIIEKLLGRKFTNGLLKADWVNGHFWSGKNLVVEKTLYLSIYRYERKFLIKNGEIIEKEEYNYIPCDYESENTLLDFILQTFDWGKFPAQSYLQFEAELNIDSFGKIKGVKIIRSNIPSFNNEIIKGLNQLPCWAVYYWKGERDNSTDWIDMKIKYEKIEKYIR